MSTQEIFALKTEKRDELKTRYDLPRRSKILVGVLISEDSDAEFLLNGLTVLPANFIVCNKVDSIKAKNIAYEDNFDSINTLGLDAIICSCSIMHLEKIMQNGVVPIVNCNNYLGKILSEFHAGRGEGNAYLYEEENVWSIYYGLVRYIENHSFPYDNKNLVKNVLAV